MKNLGRLGLAGALVLGLAAFVEQSGVQAAGGPQETASGYYKVLAPIESGNLLLFPVVRASGKSAGATPFITLDEGIKSGQVEVTEAGRARGMVRQRGMIGVPPYRGDGYPQYPHHDDSYRGDEVNTLVLVNNSDKPLLLLAGEIVTGGKQDRVIAKDRIVPAGSEPIDLGVFCIEPGRWTASSDTFGASAKAPAHSFMVQPSVRERAMVAKDQQEVWNSVRGSISQMAMASAPSAGIAMDSGSGGGYYRSMGTTSYARAMEDSSVSAKVDEAEAPVMKAREQVIAQLRKEGAIGVVVAVRGEIVWADLFVDTDLLSRYWTKLVRSYAAESLVGGETHAAPTVADAQHFLDAPSGGKESSEGDVGVYRYRELRAEGTETFVLESLLPGTGYNVHISKLKLREVAWRTPKPHPIHHEPVIRPDIPTPHYEPQIYYY
ncbi:MAG: DUF6569 family protein [Terracidiphilus sp.]|jgi:hypothetical protein